MTDTPKTCDTCKWWEPDDDWPHIQQPQDFETGKTIPQKFRVRRCHSPKLHEFERPTHNDGASVADGSEYIAVLFTAEKFGCVNWKAQQND